MTLEDFKKKCLDEQDKAMNGQGMRWHKMNHMQRKYGKSFQPVKCEDGYKCPSCGKLLEKEHLWTEDGWNHGIYNCLDCGYEFAYVFKECL